VLISSFLFFSSFLTLLPSHSELHQLLVCTMVFTWFFDSFSLFVMLTLVSYSSGLDILLHSLQSRFLTSELNNFNCSESYSFALRGESQTNEQYSCRH
jgi:hypothetical protein